jgi:hypothetical protein
MFGCRFFAGLVLVAVVSPTSYAQEYQLPAGVTVLTEEQLLNQIIGNTLLAGGWRWGAYFEPPIEGQKKGRFRGRSAVRGPTNPTSGDWTVNDELMCWYFDDTTLSAYSGCFTTELKGDTVKWYLPSGHPRYSRAGRIRLVPGNPENY